ncbi:MAG TPA: hypothetical protein VNS58_06885 [Puia sp.]|nr:hypothetical protein [Puia sp.]
MQLFRTLSVLVIFAGSFMPAPVSAQKQKNPVNSLFSDLPIDDAAGNSVLNPGESGEEKIKENIFILGSLNKSICYSGESLLLTYQLYSALQSKSLVTERPGLGNFNIEERPLNNERPLLKKKEGKDYRVFTIWQVQLNPFQPGDLTIGPLSANNEVSYVADDQTHSYSGFVNSNMIALTVLPLPAYQGAEAFSGAIGKFGFRAFVLSNRIAAGEADTLCLEIDGAGNLNAITMPAVKWPAGVETFPFKEKWVSVKNAFPPTGKKMISIPFVAHNAGHCSIPSVRFSYFDPSLKAYRELQSGAIDLDILPALAGAGENKPAVLTPPVVNRADYSWILWSLGAFGISVLAFWLLRRRSHPYMGSPAAGAVLLPEGGVVAIVSDWRTKLEELRAIRNKEQYIIKSRAILSGYLQESWQPRMAFAGSESSEEEDELIESLYRNTQDVALVEDVRSFYARCSRLLYAPSDLAEVDASLAGMVSLIIERCEIHKNINR